MANQLFNIINTRITYGNKLISIGFETWQNYLMYLTLLISQKML